LPQRFEFNYLKGDLLRFLGSASESIEAFRNACEDAADDIERCRAWMGLAEGLGINEEYDELLDILAKAEKIAESNMLIPELARIYQIRGNVHFGCSETRGCLEAHKISLKFARKAVSPELEAQALSGLGDAEYSRGRNISAHRYFDQCIEIAREHSNSRVIAANLPMRAVTFRWQNDIESAKADSQEALELAENIRQTRAEMVALLGGRVWSEAGDYPEAEKRLRRGLALTNRLGWNVAEAYFLSNLGKNAFLQGDRQEAFTLTKKSVDMMRNSKTGMVFAGSTVLGTLALVTEDPNQSLAILEEAESLLASGDGVGRNLWFFEDAMKACLQIKEWDEVDRYAQVLEDFTRPEPLPRCDFFIARSRVLAEHGRGLRDQVTLAKLQHCYDKSVRIGLKSAQFDLETALKSG
jgi:tetratricopeptide (TPR) repeat protein